MLGHDDGHMAAPSVSGVLFGWALRAAVLWGTLGMVGLLLWQSRAELLELFLPAPSANVATARPGPISNELVYRASASGHFFVDGFVNGSPIRFVVDTGATYVSLTPDDARAAGIDPDRLQFTLRSQTANGVAQMAPITLREVRLGQLSLTDVPAVVMRSSGVSLLGMSFLRRLDGYQIRDGELTISW